MRKRRPDLFLGPPAMKPNLVKQRISAGERILNGWCSIATSYVAAAIAHQGFHLCSIQTDMRMLVGASKAVNAVNSAKS